jgi:hypothetical protein
MNESEDSLVITPKSKQQSEQPPTGLQPAACVDARNLGIQSTKFGEKHRLSIVFELQATDSGGDHFILTNKYNKSLHPKSNLRSDLERWRGAPFDEDDLRRGFDLSKVIGKSCMLYLEDRDGYIAIESILPPEDIQYKPSGDYTRAEDR